MADVIHPTFLGDAQIPYQDARVVVERAPYDGTTSYGSGARTGPQAIIDASSQVEFYDIELAREPADVGIYTVADYLVDLDGPGAAIEQVHARCHEHVQAGKTVLLLGGEHSVSFAGAKACATAHGEISILQIDAHLDLRDKYQGSPHSHACVARRMLDLGRVVAVGARAACPEELDVVRRHGLDPVWADRIAEQRHLPLHERPWIEQAIGQLSERVYVTVDVDGFDPSVFPSTGTPVPGGLLWHEALTLLRRVGQQRQVVGFDLVELSAANDPRSAFAAALLAYKMIGYFVA